MGSNPIKTVGQGLGAIGTGGLSLAFPKSPFGSVGNDIGTGLTFGANGGTLTNPFNGNSLFGGSSNPYVSGPFSLDPNQVAGDESAINNLGGTQNQQTTALGQTLAGQTNQLGQQQYNQTAQQIPTTVANQIAQENPQIMEQANASGLLTSSAYPQEVARQASYLTQNLELPAMQQQQQAQQAALGQSQGGAEQGLGQQQSAATAAAQRGMSLEDFINQANVSKTIGASMAPAAPSSKAQAGSVMQGVGALAPFAKVGKGAASAAPGLV